MFAVAVRCEAQARGLTLVGQPQVDDQGVYWYPTANGRRLAYDPRVRRFREEACTVTAEAEEGASPFFDVVEATEAA